MSERPELSRPVHDEHEHEERDDTVIGHAFKYSLAVIVILGAVAGGIALWWNRGGAPPPTKFTKLQPAALRANPGAALPKIPFVNVTEAAGIAFVLENGAYGDKLLPETMCGGCAVFDYNNDQHPDILLVNACRWPWDTRPVGKPPVMALYRNDGRGQFVDVSAEAGLAVTCYGTAAAVGDYDNDGWVDIFIAAVGSNRLFRNEQGTFRDVTETAGVAGDNQAWSTSSGFLDYDNDGDLDLFVCNYIQWSKEVDLKLRCTLVGDIRAYCRPGEFSGAFPYLYRNEGNGSFTDVSAAAGVQVANPNTGVPVAKSLGLAPVDVNNDGFLDLIVANDTVQNFLFMNQRDGTFKEIGTAAGIAFDSAGAARGAMGIDAARFRNSVALGVVIGNFSNEMSALYVDLSGQAMFTDEAISTGLGPPSRLMLKFGAFFLDADLDGRLDIFTANGHLEDEIRIVQESQRYEQPPHLFYNCGHDAPNEFQLMSEGLCGPEFTRPMVGRGAAYGDFDGDGDLDVLVTATRGQPRLLRNDQALGRHWLRAKLVGTRSNRDAIGAWVEAHVANKPVQYRLVMPTRSYMSQCELPVTFGLGDSTKVDRLVIRWPDGSAQELSDVAADQMLTIEQSTAALADQAAIGRSR